ncbi:hypothetical protein KGM_203279 [Danaus plexippus plexippus]|uniref:Methionine synthase reductase n=1 Tax=Danaus plexippus plexippus TaxID=278856 RepID=A0A212EJJ6_DANPL|nr:hypothetical protein KGM_203279 [Danaus plexippus plexippus]
MVVCRSFQEIFDSIDINSPLSLPKYKNNVLQIEFTNTKTNETVYNIKPSLPFAASDIYYSSIISSRRLTALDSNCKAVYEISLNIEGSIFIFTPGDTIAIIPHNKKSEVDFILNHLNVKEVLYNDYKLSLDSGQKGAKIPVHIPIKSNLYYVLTHCVDLRAVIKKLFLLALSTHTKDENERKLLEYLCSSEGSEAYNDHILNKGTCILDIFNTFKSCKPPVQLLLEYLPRLLPRPYSVVTSQGPVIKICFSVMEINNRKGLTTGWLEDMIVKNDIVSEMEKLAMDVTEHKIPIYMRKNMNEFHPPASVETPLILIGPGTGVSPYIGFLEEREKLIKNADSPGVVWLFFGCRDPKLDFIYEDELNNFVSSGVLNRLSTAFSRHGNTEIRYVQDLVKENGEEISKLLVEGARVYVCGDVKVMAKQVKEAFIQCLSKYTNTSTNDAELFILNMQKEKKFLIDIWN